MTARPARSGPLAESGAGRRLFIGVMADEALRAALVHHRHQWAWPPGARLTDPYDLHLTLCFLGTMAADASRRMAEALSTLALAPTEATLDEAELWRGGVAVRRVRASDALRQWQARISAAVASTGWPLEDRPWKPHVTLARHAAGAGAPRETTPITWPWRQLDLVWSHPAPGRPRYRVIQSWPAGI